MTILMSRIKQNLVTKSYGFIAITFLVFTFSGCGGGSSNNLNTTQHQEYKTTLIEINIVRMSDQQNIIVEGLPANGTTIIIE